jgi:hypothetical protein
MKFKKHTENKAPRHKQSGARKNLVDPVEEAGPAPFDAEGTCLRCGQGRGQHPGEACPEFVGEPEE